MAVRGTKITPAQRRMLAKLYLVAGTDGWYRAGQAGELSSQAERPTLASLYYRGFCVRQVHSGAGTSSPAHEYRLTPAMYAACSAAAARGKVQA